MFGTFLPLYISVPGYFVQVHFGPVYFGPLKFRPRDITLLGLSSPRTIRSLDIEVLEQFGPGLFRP